MYSTSSRSSAHSSEPSSSHYNFSSEVKEKDAFDAMDYARKALEKANVTFYTIDSAKKEGNIWLVKASSL